MLPASSMMTRRTWLGMRRRGSSHQKTRETHRDLGLLHSGAWRYLYAKQSSKVAKEQRSVAVSLCQAKQQSSKGAKERGGIFMPSKVAKQQKSKGAWRYLYAKQSSKVANSKGAWRYLYAKQRSSLAKILPLTKNIFHPTQHDLQLSFRRGNIQVVHHISYNFTTCQTTFIQVLLPKDNYTESHPKFVALFKS